MSKCARHQPGFYASLFDDVYDRGLSYKYRPKQKPVVMGIYEGERIVSKRNQWDSIEYFVQWKNYSSTENTSEPSEHLPEDLIATFERRPVDPVCIDECRERLALLFEKGLKATLACNKNIVMRQNVMQALFPGLPSDLRTTPYLVDEDEMIAAGLGSCLKKCLTVTGGGCCVDTPVSIKLFLGKSPVFLDEHGRKTASRPVEKVQVKFTKSWFTGNMQWKWTRTGDVKNGFFRSHQI